MSTSESWGVNRRTAWYTSPVSVTSQCKLVSGWGLRKRRSAPFYGPCGLGRTLLMTSQTTCKQAGIWRGSDTEAPWELLVPLLQLTASPTRTSRYILGFCFASAFFQSYSKLDYPGLGRSPKVNSWVLSQQNINRPDALPVAQRTA